ncbi:ketol-acid reductoisomerase, partial [Vibrio fortis]
MNSFGNKATDLNGKILKRSAQMANYFNTLNLREQLDQLGRCRFMDRSEFATEADYLK